MILQALVKRYEDTADVKPGWQKIDVILCVKYCGGRTTSRSCTVGRSK
jgi:hypothetical protein